MYREGERDPFQLSYWTRPTILCQEALTLYIYPQLRQHQNLWWVANTSQHVVLSCVLWACNSVESREPKALVQFAGCMCQVKVRNILMLTLHLLSGLMMGP